MSTCFDISDKLYGNPDPTPCIIAKIPIFSREFLHLFDLLLKLVAVHDSSVHAVHEAVQIR